MPQTQHEFAALIIRPRTNAPYTGPCIFLVLNRHTGTPFYINTLSPYYETLQYTLLYPFGERACGIEANAIRNRDGERLTLM